MVETTWAPQFRSPCEAKMCRLWGRAIGLLSPGGSRQTPSAVRFQRILDPDDWLARAAGVPQDFFREELPSNHLRYRSPAADWKGPPGPSASPSKSSGPELRRRRRSEIAALED